MEHFKRHSEFMFFVCSGNRVSSRSLHLALHQEILSLHPFGTNLDINELQLLPLDE